MKMTLIAALLLAALLRTSLAADIFGPGNFNPDAFLKACEARFAVPFTGVPEQKKQSCIGQFALLSYELVNRRATLANGWVVEILEATVEETARLTVRSGPAWYLFLAQPPGNFAAGDLRAECRADYLSANSLDPLEPVGQWVRYGILVVEISGFSFVALETDKLGVPEAGVGKFDGSNLYIMPSNLYRPSGTLIRYLDRFSNTFNRSAYWQDFVGRRDGEADLRAFEVVQLTPIDRTQSALLDKCAARIDQLRRGYFDDMRAR